MKPRKTWENPVTSWDKTRQNTVIPCKNPVKPGKRGDRECIRLVSRLAAGVQWRIRFCDRVFFSFLFFFADGTDPFSSFAHWPLPSVTWPDDSSLFDPFEGRRRVLPSFTEFYRVFIAGPAHPADFLTRLTHFDRTRSMGRVTGRKAKREMSQLVSFLSVSLSNRSLRYQ